MIVLLEDEGDLSVRRVRWRERLASRLRVSELDAALAAGTAPESSVSLALHAEHVSRPAQRHLLARSLRRISALSEAPATGRRSVPVNRVAVRHARHEIEAVADRLTSEGPVDVQGVARLRALLSDGSGPLYRPVEAGRLQRELVTVRSAMAPEW
ncbi:MAG TPA: hypothetical protein VGG09_01170 [Acidimicrobiales bacterium]|jgi:hypothetical protein